MYMYMYTKTQSTTGMLYHIPLGLHNDRVVYKTESITEGAINTRRGRKGRGRGSEKGVSTEENEWGGREVGFTPSVSVHALVHVHVKTKG